jgi:hypothetical protein
VPATRAPTTCFSTTMHRSVRGDVWLRVGLARRQETCRSSLTLPYLQASATPISFVTAVRSTGCGACGGSAASASTTTSARSATCTTSTTSPMPLSAMRQPTHARKSPSAAVSLPRTLGQGSQTDRQALPEPFP